MKEIELTQGFVALVDDKDYPILSVHKWQALLIKKTGMVYAGRSDRDASGKRVTVRMHCFIKGKKGIDHKDGNGLNNQRYNLRECTQLGNTRNAGKSSRLLTSQYKGVCKRTEYVHSIKWRAQITVNYKKIVIGTFDEEVYAAQAYDAAAKFHFGEFARLNFP